MRTFVGAQTMMFLEDEAKERQATSTGGTSPQLVVNLPEAVDKGRSREKAAELVGVSPSLIQHAKKVRDG